MNIRPSFAFTGVVAAGLVFAFANPARGHVILDQPDGGEVLQAGSVYTVTWHIQIAHTLLNWDVWYSTTGAGGPWIPIATDLPAGDQTVNSIHTFDWVTPDTPTTQARVRVRMDNAATDYEDVSNGDFTIETAATDANIDGASSLRTHGAGPGLELAIDLDDSGGIEPRQGGANKLTFLMSENMDADTVNCGNVQIDCSNANDLVCTDASLGGNQQTVTIELNGSAGQANCCAFLFDGMETDTGGMVLELYDVVMLEGDVNFSGGVTGADPSLIKPHFGEIVGVDLAGPQFDYDVSGAVTGGDFALIKTRLGNVAPACP